MTPLTWALALLLLGLIFLVLEFFIPSGGALSVVCALSFLGAIVVGFFAGPWTGLVMLLAVCLTVPAATMAAIRWWPDTPFGKLILIERPTSPDEVLPETVAYRGLKEFIGRRGQAKGLMMPGGSVVIDGKSYEAVSEGMAIEPHQPIIVVSVSMQRLIVRPDTTIQAQLAEQATHQASPSHAEPLVADIPDPFAD